MADGVHRPRNHHRRRNLRPRRPGKFRSPLYSWVQVISLLLSVVVMVSLGVEALSLGAIFLLTGVIFYGIIEERKKRGNQGQAGG